jgi:hypothetical protein
VAKSLGDLLASSNKAKSLLESLPQVTESADGLLVQVQGGFITRFELEFPNRSKLQPNEAATLAMVEGRATIELLDSIGKVADWEGDVLEQLQDRLQIHLNLAPSNNHCKLMQRRDDIMKQCIFSIFERSRELLTQWWLCLPHWGDDKFLLTLTLDDYATNPLMATFLERFYMHQNDLGDFAYFMGEANLIRRKIAAVDASVSILKEGDAHVESITKDMTVFSAQLTRLNEIVIIMEVLERSITDEITAGVARLNKVFCGSGPEKKQKKLFGPDSDYIDRLAGTLLAGIAGTLGVQPPRGPEVKEGSGSNGVSVTASLATGSKKAVKAAKSASGPDDRSGAEDECGDDDPFAQVGGDEISKQRAEHHALLKSTLSEWRLPEFNRFRTKSEMLWTNAAAAELDVTSFMSWLEDMPEVLITAYGMGSKHAALKIAQKSAQVTKNNIENMVKDVVAAFVEYTHEPLQLLEKTRHDELDLKTKKTEAE